MKLDYIVAPPQMAHYMEVSTKIYEIYLRYVSPEDIHVYSIDEVFIDATGYLKTYRCTAHELAMRIPFLETLSICSRFLSCTSKHKEIDNSIFLMVSSQLASEALFLKIVFLSVSYAYFTVFSSLCKAL